MTVPVFGRACPHEGEVLDLVVAGHWPDRADASLRAHVAACAACGEVASVAAILAPAFSASIDVARVPDASLVWGRAEWRAREESVRRAARPISLVQLVALACVLAAGGIWWTTAAHDVATLWTASAAPALNRLGTWLPAFPGARWILASAAAWAVLIPVAFYVATLADGPDFEVGIKESSSSSPAGPHARGAPN